MECRPRNIEENGRKTARSISADGGLRLFFYVRLALFGFQMLYHVGKNA